MTDLVERYIQAVEHYLPEAQQHEITRELRANIMDEIDALATYPDEVINEQQISEVISRQGHPQQVAQSFVPQYPLIASEDMPLYKTVLSKGALFLFAYAILTAGRYLVSEQSVNGFAFLWVALGSFIDNIGIVVIAITAVFYLLGRGGYLAQWRYPSWSPESLPAVTAQPISTSDSASDVATGVFGLLLLWTPLWMNEETYQSLVIGIAPDMEQWRWILSCIVAFSLFAALYRLTQTYWTKRSMSVYIAEYLVYIAVMLTLWQSPALVIVTNPQAEGLIPIIAQIFNHGWLVGVFILSIITLGLVRQWRKL